MCIWGCQLFVAFKRVTAQSMLEYEITVCVSFLNLNSLLHEFCKQSYLETISLINIFLYSHYLLKCLTM